MKVIKSLSQAMEVVKSYRNFHIYFMDCLSFHSLLPFIEAWKGKEVIYTLRNGIKLKARLSTDDRSIIDEVFILRMYTPPEFTIRDDYTVVDIGAHIGTFSVLAATNARNVKVYSYEPLAENFDLLRENIRLNGLTTNIEAFKNIVGGKRGKRKLFYGTRGVSSSCGGSSEIEEVECVTLADIFDMNDIERCDFLKLDVEGAEYEILLNMNEKYLKNIRRISMECHIRPFGHCKDLRVFLERSGFEVKLSEGGHPTLFYLYAKRSCIGPTLGNE